jgi:hypothetical protein
MPVEANLGLATTYELIMELKRRAMNARELGESWPDYQPIAPSGQMTTEQVIELGREAMKKYHPAMYSELMEEQASLGQTSTGRDKAFIDSQMRKEASASSKLDGETYVVDPEKCLHDDWKTEGEIFCGKCGKDMRSPENQTMYGTGEPNWALADFARKDKEPDYLPAESGRIIPVDQSGHNTNGDWSNG